MPLSSPVSPRDLALKEKRFHSLEEVEAAFNLTVRRLNEVYRYNRRDHDRLTEDVEDVSTSVTLTIEAHTSDDTLTEAESGSVHTNRGASGGITLTLPSGASVGTLFYFVVQEAALSFTIQPDGSAIILRNGGIAGRYIRSFIQGSAIALVVDDDGNLTPILESGSWTMEP